MASRNLEVARRGIEAFQSGDLSTWLEIFTEDVVWIPLGELPDITEPVVGRAAVLDLVQSYLDPWDQMDIETVELEEYGDVVLWTYRQTLIQEANNLRFDTSISAVLEFDGGLTTRVRFYWDRDEALAAASGEAP
jgi:ketosteroid isomerase-like protein